MNRFTSELITQAKKSGLLAEFPAITQFPLPVINKVELYLSFFGNDSCAHCITSSGPHRKTLLSPENAERVIRNVAEFSLLEALQRTFNEGIIHFKNPASYDRLDSSKSPPVRVSDELIQEYADRIMGKGSTAEWINADGTVPLPFGRPSLRISGGEFYTWPHRIKGKLVDEPSRLGYQRKLLKSIRKYLPAYDIWILTNGRFAESLEKTRAVLAHWAPEDKGSADNTFGRTRVVVSVDPFHKPPRNSTVEQMLDRLWTCSHDYLQCAPHIYSISGRKLFLAGRALSNFQCGTLSDSDFNNVSQSSLIAFDYLKTDPHNLIETDGCEELKGFLCQTPAGNILVNNIVINDSGNLAYCCVGVGDYGDFVHSPRVALQQLLKDPVSLMLRKGSTAKQFLNMAVDMDPTIKVFGSSQYERATGSTCYQVLSGKRVTRLSKNNSVGEFVNGQYP